MSDEVVKLMLGASLFLGFLGVVAFIWGLKTNQFDDAQKFKEGALHDTVDDLNEAIELEKREKEVKS